MNRMNDDRSYSGLVQKYIGTAYDKVAAVADNLGGIGTVAEIIDDGRLDEILALGPDIALAVLLSNYKGAWNPAVNYVVGDSVSDRGNLWVATEDNKKEAPTDTNPFWYGIKAARLSSVDVLNDLPEDAGTVDTMFVRGSVNIGDGGGGAFQYILTQDRAQADNGIIIDPTNTGTGMGCWVRQFTGPVNVKWFGALGDGVTDDAPAIKAACDSFTREHPYPGLRLAGIVFFPPGDYRVCNLVLNRGGVKLQGAGISVTRISSDTSDTAITFQPLLNGHPNTNGHISKFFAEDISFYAASDDARRTGTGVHLINAILGQFENVQFMGFQRNLFLSSVHFIKLSMVDFRGSKETSIHPTEAIHFNGLGIVVDKTITHGQPVSTGLQVNGGWFSNSTLDLENCQYAVLNNFDIEPASRTVKVGYYSKWTNCRFERFEHYSIGSYAIPGRPRFTWFEIEGDGNVFEHCSVHFNGANNNIEVNPIFDVKGNHNRFKFSNYSASYGLIKFGYNTYGNFVEFNKFNDFSKFAAVYPNYHVENICGVFRGNNNGYRLNEARSHVIVEDGQCKVVGCTSVIMKRHALIQGASKAGKKYTITGGANQRIILNFGTSAVYKQKTYGLKLRVTSTFNDVQFKISGAYTDTSHMQWTKGNLNGQYMIIRFHISADTPDPVKMLPAIHFHGASGETFELDEVELLEFDAGPYEKHLLDHLIKDKA